MVSKQAFKVLVLIVMVLTIPPAFSIAAESAGHKTKRLYRQKQQDAQSTYTRKPYVRPSKKQMLSRFEVIEELPVIEESAPAPVVIDQPAEIEIHETQPELLPEVEPVQMPAPEPVQLLAANLSVLDLIPADSLFCVVINDLDNALEMTNSYLAGAIPFPVAMMAKMQLGSLLGNEMLLGMDTKGSFAFFARNVADKTEPVIAILVPVTDYDEFLRSSRNISDPDENGVSAVLVPNMGDMKLRKLSANYGIISEAPGIADNAGAGAIAVTLSSDEKKRGTNAPLWAYGNLQAASGIFGPMLIARTQQQMAALAAMGQPQDPGESEAKMKMLTAVLNQFKSLSITLTPSQNVLKLNINFAAKPDSEIAYALRPDPNIKPGFKMSGYLNSPAVLAAAVKSNVPMQKKLEKIFHAFMPKEDPRLSAVDSDVYMGDEQVFFLALARQMPFFSASVITNIKQHQGKNLAKYYEKAYRTEMQIVMEQMQSAPGPGQFMAAFIMPKTQTSGNMVLSAFGADSDNQLNSLAALTASAPPAPTGDIKVAMDIIDDSQNAGFIASFNIIRLLNAAKNFAPMIPIPQAQMALGALANINIPTQSCIAIAGRTNNGKANLQVILPKQHLTELFAAGMMIQQQIMTQQMQMKNASQ